MTPTGWVIGALVIGAVAAIRYLVARAHGATTLARLGGEHPTKWRVPSFAAIAVAPRQIAAAVIDRRRLASYDATLAVALETIARVVRGGGSLSLAIGEAALSMRGAVADDLGRVAAAAQRGERLEHALAQWRADRDRGSVRLAAGAIALAAATGGPPARVIEDVAASLRTRLQIEGEAKALGAQAQLSALVVGIAPVAFALVSCAVDPANARVMFTTPIGLACLVAGVTLDVIGAVWMHRVSETVLG